MDALIKDGEVTRGFLGVEQRDLTPEIAQTLNLSVKRGVLITGVLQSGPASAGGLRPGDVVTAIGAKQVLNTSQLLNAVAALRPNAVAKLAVQRGGEALDVSVTVGQRPKARAPLPQIE
jgi:serine protease DegQ